jgi:dihydroorotate dehydrogenase electron transfer subunit
MNYPKITLIIETKNETADVKTIFFSYPGEIVPGQFFMIWIPGVDEIPMSVSYIDKDVKGITFKKVGEATNALFKLKKDNKIGIRGPYGNGFKINGKHVLFIGGGTGIAMIAPAVESTVNKNIHTTVVLGVKTKEDLFFEERIRKSSAKVFISTDDGSKGQKGIASDLAGKLLNENNYDLVLTCGPELMMKQIFDLSKNISFQASLERYIKCGFGICGQCCIGEGLRVCEEGPVFDGKTLKHVEEFGVFQKDASGRKIRL